ncbi:MAG: indole-3-glycerol-phosphate synthase TrpC, partial [Actinobacteria bacterium]|nr:indole-3-glycerol-phosphate synthase TrpC [Actinomycetota bacterium]
MTVLDDILAGVREDLAVRMAGVPIDELKERAAHVRPARDVYSVLKGDGVSVIAEVKRSSPSRGALAEILSPASLAL